jgi:signal transduction histidine kinase
MDLIHNFFLNNLDIVFFVYGLAFVVMGVTILVRPRRASEFKISNILWLLGLFGLTHGSNELLDMWAIIKGRTLPLDYIRWVILVISYFFLFEFGRQLFHIAALKSRSCERGISRLLVWWITPLIGLYIFIAGFMSHDFWEMGSIWTRYLLGFPGGLLIGFGFRLYYDCEEKTLESLKVKKYFVMGGISFLIYGILGGLVVPKENFFPSNCLNTETFLAVVKIPVQVFRAGCAIFAALSVAGMLKIFNWEISSKLQIYQKRLRKLMSKLSIAEEQERKRISGELHDNISQNLALSKIKLSALSESCPEIAKDLNETRELIDETIKFTRSLTFELSPPILYELGLESAIDWLAEQIQVKHGIIIKVDCENGPVKPSVETSVLLFKTVRELLINIVKHAKASEAKIFIKLDGNAVRITVEDNGIGFNVSEIDPYLALEGGFGILNIRERINYLKGEFKIESEKGRGTKVEIVVPLLNG